MIISGTRYCVFALHKQQYLVWFVKYRKINANYVEIIEVPYRGVFNMENRDQMSEIHVKTNVIKRNGQEVSFDISKIINAIGKANKEVESIHQMNEFQIRAVADMIAKRIASFPPRSECGRYPGYGGKGHHGNAGLRSGTEVCALSV